MTYPSPYQPPQMPSGPGQPLMAPPAIGLARRAGILLIFLSSLEVLCSSCMGMGGMMYRSLDDEKKKELLQGFDPRSLPPGVTIDQMMKLIVVLGAAGFVFGIVLLVLALFVRRASKVAMVFAAILCALVVLMLGINILSALTKVLGGDTQQFFAMMLLLVVFAGYGLALLWLLQVLRELPKLQAAMQQQQAQVWQMQQQQQIYNQGTYGYGYPPQPQGYGQPAASVAPQPPAAETPPATNPPIPPDQPNPGGTTNP